MSGDSDGPHPARKIDQDELVSVLANKNEDVPALTSRFMSAQFPEVGHQAVRKNLDELANNSEICRFDDGDTKVYWFPREHDEAGTIEYSEVVEDSINWEEVDVRIVPEDIAKDIATQRLPYYRPRSFWSLTTHASQLGVMLAFGLVILGIGGLVANTLGIGQNTAARLFNSGLYLALFSMFSYVLSLILDELAARGHVPVDPLSRFRSEDNKQN